MKKVDCVDARHKIFECKSWRYLILYISSPNFWQHQPPPTGLEYPDTQGASLLTKGANDSNKATLAAPQFQISHLLSINIPISYRMSSLNI